MLRQLNISNLQNFIHLTSLPACKPEQPCFLKSWKHLRVTCPVCRPIRDPSHEAMPAMPASRKEASRDGGSGSISSWGWAARQPNGWRNTFRNTAVLYATPYSTLVMCNEWFYAHIILFRNIKYADSAYYVDILRMMNILFYFVTTSFPCNNVCSSKMYLSSTQTFAFLWRSSELPAEFHPHKADLFAVVYPPANLVEQSAKQRITCKQSIILRIHLNQSHYKSFYFLLKISSWEWIETAYSAYQH